MQKTILPQLEQSRKAKYSLAKVNGEASVRILEALADSLLKNEADIIRENQKDLDRMDPQDAKYDRLRLDAARIRDIAASILDVSRLEDPRAKLLSEKTLENGLHIVKKTVALGVVAVIYESRPNVTVDVASLCIRSGNACLLRGGSDAWYSNSILLTLIQEVLQQAGLDPNIVQLLPTDRELLSELLTATEYVDIVIPRGSQRLINFVREHAKVPVIETGAGVCHTYVDQTANLEKAARIIANAKISRPSVCNALDTILLDRQIAEQLIGQLSPYFQKAQVTVYADETSYPYWANCAQENLEPATEADFGREFLDLKCSVKVVDGLEDALNHIAKYSSKHSECIISLDSENISTFMQAVDAAAVYANASTRFTDGGEFGLGAEIGISTQKLHARGPFALEKLVCEKWFVNGDGQIRE